MYGLIKTIKTHIESTSYLSEQNTQATEYEKKEPQKSTKVYFFEVAQLLITKTNSVKLCFFSLLGLQCTQ